MIIFSRTENLFGKETSDELKIKMKNDVFSKFGGRQRVGVTHIRNVKTREVLKYIGFSDETQIYDVESSDGSLSTIHAREISKDVTPEEEAEFNRSKIG